MRRRRHPLTRWVEYRRTRIAGALIMSVIAAEVWAMLSRGVRGTDVLNLVVAVLGFGVIIRLAWSWARFDDDKGSA